MKNKFARKVVFIVLICAMVGMLGGCGWLDNEVKNIKGDLIGNNFTIDFYDHMGSNILTIDGKKVGLEANYTQTQSINAEGQETTNYELSSVVTLTVDGHQIPATGSSIIFTEEGLNKLEDFELPETIETSGGSVNIIDRNINKIKNVLGTGKVVIVCSQMGVPIAVYGGKTVYWDIPDDLPKTTKLNIDGKALYIHRATYVVLDANMIK